MIGSSWIYTASEFFTLYGAGGVVIGLAVATVFVAFIALAYAELASLFPRAGGEVVFAYVAFNRGVAFTAGWLLIGAYVSSLAFYVTSVGFLLSRVFPELSVIPLYTINEGTVYLPVLVVGVLVTLAVFAANWRGITFGAWTQLVFLIAMVVLGLVIAVVGFLHGSAENFWPPYAGDTGESVGQTARFVLPAMTFLTGFALVTTLAEDAKVTPRRLGRAVLMTVGIAGGFYCLVLLATAWVIPWQETAALEEGTINAFRAAGYPTLGWSAFAIAVIGLVTSFLALFVATSRIVLAMARARLLPSGLAALHPRHRTPTRALTFTLVVVLCLGWMGTEALVWFLDTGGVYVGLAWFIGVLCLYRIRSTHRHLSAPFRAWPSAAPAVGAVFAVGVIVFALWPNTDLSLIWPWEYVILIAWATVGVLLYLWSRGKDDGQAMRTLLGEHYDSTVGSNRT
ncbi:APC family permease [Spiractinospora alimapuensis]|nr:APC family permease [Spiractinospora alimapuensis]QVQ51911.1 APC family permease [Spiractinospora alimapuensis]